MKRIVIATVLNQSGVLNKITGVLAKRKFNIESITVGHTENDGISRMTFVVNVDDDAQAEQLTKQLNKLIDVIKVQDVTDQAIVARELALVKVLSTAQTRSEIGGIVEPFRASIIDVSRDSVTIQVTGDSEKVEALIDLLKPYGIKEMVRTGLTAFLRGSQKQVTDLSSYSLLK
ncbi:acetolactate synthase small subunit [Heyndrickxia ginsengihumi]|uniref:Acetolactate synthase small subunit n=1 Tax=Heyndrickxia ginsengihumi TaxID=363870 RepID=A0A0A6VC28_9BACI|nr:acetolactate synthase small subunit [Heyndrickxia ginsengihumi]KHD85136.1 acetolactate synthase [Heyndrickxia ginsengihumi]MBE6183555.1 acetolactate synthase small subunit [Bacillus sp. (in: firmicutes)]MCM3024531.1 acetolactate synthase small subunit [Heyndrickxia ginsengihumi]NEY20161.1 acetolactate synthase small subunit [Heyndrickxia ginsengihumi]